VAGRAKATNRALSSGQKNGIFRIGVASALLDEALLPLRGDLTGRRLGLLVYLHGSDIREKYSGVRHSDERHCPVGERSVAPRAIKTNQSTTLFVLHDFLKEIGFVDWARAQGQAFLFPELTRLVDPSKSGSSYMQRLFRKAGVSGNGRGVFHSLRGGHLDFMRNAKVDLATGGFKGATRSTTNTTSMASRRSRKVWAMDFVHDQLATGKRSVF